MAKNTYTAGDLDDYLIQIKKIQRQMDPQPDSKAKTRDDSSLWKQDNAVVVAKELSGLQSFGALKVSGEEANTPDQKIGLMNFKIKEILEDLSNNKGIYKDLSQQKKAILKENLTNLLAQYGSVQQTVREKMDIKK